MTEPNAESRRLKEVSADAEPEEPSAKRLKSNNDAQEQATPKVLTFQVSGSDVQVQVLSTHTLFDLCDVVLKECGLIVDENVYSQLWNMTDKTTNKVYEGPTDFFLLRPRKSELQANNTKIGEIAAGMKVGRSLLLKYDFGSTTHCRIRLAAIDDLGSEEIQAFPRRKPLALPSGFRPYSPADSSLNLDHLFPELSKFLFKRGNHGKAFLFQPGQKKHQAFLENNVHGCHNMIHAPEKFASLDELLASLNQACTEYKMPTLPVIGCPLYNWFGITVYPHAPMSPQAIKKYIKLAVEGGEIDRVFHAEEYLGDSVTKAFPKCASAAGYAKHKTKDRAWVVYGCKILKICKGTSMTIKNKHAPSPSALDGMDAFQPAPGCIVTKVGMEIKSLQELFCAVESLLETM